MITILITNIITFFTSTSWLTKILTLLLLWFTPALELFLLLMIIMTADFLLDTYMTYSKSKPNKSIKREIWNVTKLYLTKVFFYSLLIILMNGLQLHLIKESFNIFRWVIAVPIISESFGIMSTIESYTGIKIIDSVKKFFKNMLNKEGIDESIVDDISHSNQRKDNTTE